MKKDLKTRLSGYKENPNPHVWDRISAALEDDNSVGRKLYRYQQEPPLGIWKNVAAGLDDQSTHAPVPFYKRRIIQYVSAAAIILIILSGSIFLNNQQQAVQPATAVKETTNEQPPKAATTKTVDAPEQNSPIAFQVHPAVSRKTSHFHRSSYSQGVVNPTPNELSIDLQSSEAVSIGAIKDQIQRLDFSDAERYMVYSDDNGNVAKLPKRLYASVNCADADMSCKMNLECLREKASAATFSTDFIGVVQLLRQVQENQ